MLACYIPSEITCHHDYLILNYQSSSKWYDAFEWCFFVHCSINTLCINLSIKPSVFFFLPVMWMLINRYKLIHSHFRVRFVSCRWLVLDLRTRDVVSDLTDGNEQLSVMRYSPGQVTQSKLCVSVPAVARMCPHFSRLNVNIYFCACWVSI